jgi:hypothetical protein
VHSREAGFDASDTGKDIRKLLRRANATHDILLASSSNKGPTVRISVSHNQPKEEVIQKIDQSINDLFKEAGALPVKLVMQQKSWQGSVMTFALTAKMGIMSTPIKGTVEVTDRDIIIDADLGMFNRFVNEKTAQQAIGNRLKGLLN